MLIYNELSDHIEEFLARSYNGIVQQLAEGCVRYQINGEDLIQVDLFTKPGIFLRFCYHSIFLNVYNFFLCKFYFQM